MTAAPTHRTARPVHLLATDTESLETFEIPAGVYVVETGTVDDGRICVETYDELHHGAVSPADLEAVPAPMDPALRTGHLLGNHAGRPLIVCALCCADGPLIRDTREAAVVDVRILHDAGNAATVYGPVAGRFLALDLDAPVVDVVDALEELGLGAEDASDAALRLVARGY